MKRAVFIFISVLVVASFLSAGDGDIDKEKAGIKQVIEDSYVKGVHVDRNVKAIRKGFHPAFNMFILKDNNVSTWSIDHWIDVIETGLKKDPMPPKHETTHEISMIDVTGDAAVAKIEIYRDGKHIFTDYLSLYKLKEGWKIVGKIFCRHS
ncbi:MAG TPA: nuclear transport factor 2 family protein [Patescibacteria group bacterium]|nr:nuclear transport factor 2 family protein [Patescibacteria group bacterium]